MPKCVNKVTLLGYVGAGPECSSMPSGDTVAKLRLATSKKWKDKATGEGQESTEWHSVTMFRGLAEVAQKYVNKGDMIYVEGHLKTRKWEDATGTTKFFTEVIADDLSLLSGKREVAQMPPKGHMAYECGDDLPF